MNDKEPRCCGAATSSIELVASESSEDGAAAAAAAPTSNDNDTVQLKCMAGSIVVERSLLTAASSYFAKMLANDSKWAEAKTKVVDLGLWCHSHLLVIIQCLKTGDPGPALRDINSVFTAIDYFSIRPLRDVCIEHKLSQISITNAIDEFYFADYHSIDRLRQRCLKYLTIDVEHLLEQPHINRKVSKQLVKTLLSHRDLVVVNEDAVLALIDRWCSIDGRHVHRAELLESVRFAHLTRVAFERCRRDEQCRKVAAFRALLDSTRWSELDERILLGRPYSQTHMHAAWLCEKVANDYEPGCILDVPERNVEVFVTCSQDDGTRPLVALPLSRSYASALVCGSQLALVGNQLFFYKRSQREFILKEIRMAGVKCVLVLPDGRSRQRPSVSVSFKRDILPVAAPVIVAGDLYIAHVVYRKPKAETLEVLDLQHVELLRYRLNDVDAPPNRTKLAIELKDLSELVNTHEENKLVVSGEWKMLLLLTENLLVAAGRRPANGAIIQLPDKDVVMSTRDSCLLPVRRFSDMLIVGNLAYIVVEFRCFRLINEQFSNERRAGFCNQELFGSIFVCDLVTGTFLPGRRVDLTATMLEKLAGSLFLDFQLYLRQVHDELYLLGFTRHSIVADELQAAGRGFAYRLQSDTDQMRLIPVIDDLNINSVKVDVNKKTRIQRWIGRPLNVDAHPCEHASALQHHASQERDPLRLEKLRRFT